MTDSPDAKPEFDAKAARAKGAKILERIKAAEKREEKWIKAAEAAEVAYANRKEDGQAEGKEYQFNILHSNVETIVPAIYNSTPIPDVRPRRVEATGPEPSPPPPNEQTGQPDPMATMQFKKAAEAFASKKSRDVAAKEYGRMIERAIAVQIDDNRLDAEIEGAAQDAFLAGRGVPRLRFEADDDGAGGVQNERITFEVVSWRDYREGPATRWDGLPWQAFHVPMARETFERFAEKGNVEAQEALEPEKAAALNKDSEIIYHWEYWDKIERKVYWVREDDGVVIKAVDDPLGLPGFFSTPQPLQPITLTGRRMPVCPFSIYRELAEELDTVTKRIKAIVKGMKLRGIVAGNASTLSKLAEADDNEIVVETELEQMVQTGGLDKAIAWWPIEKAVAVLAQLYQQREQIKSAIYEITGISDIVRGASNAGETATAQQIKTQWGSLRIQKMQRLIERQVRDIFVMMAHLISTKFSPQTLTAMTGIEVTPEIEALMKSPAEANYRVNVETNSTVRADLTNQKKEMGEFLSGTSQFFSTMAPVIQQAPQSAEPIAEIYAAAVRPFSLGKQAEDAIEQFVQIAKQAAKQPPPDPNAGKAEEAQAKAQLENRKLDIEERRVGIEEGRAAQEVSNADRDHSMRMAESRLQQGEDGTIEPEDRKEQAMMQAIMQGLSMLAEAIQQGNLMTMQGQAEMVKMIQAPRQTQLHVGADGKKTAISTPVVVN